MMIKTLMCCFFFSLSAELPLHELFVQEQFKEKGYVEWYDAYHGATAYDTVYQLFDDFIVFLQQNPQWAHKLYAAKERFIRSKDQNYYATDFFGFYDESRIKGRDQISFYYSVHFHDFIISYCPDIKKIPEIIHFFDACRQIQQPYGALFMHAAQEIYAPTIFESSYEQPPILLKVVKYLSSYTHAKPHYDGSVFSLLLDSTDNQSLLLSPYKTTYAPQDFVTPVRVFTRSLYTNSIILIPGTLLIDQGIYPTPHIVTQTKTVRYATIAFAMRPHYLQKNSSFTVLPSLSLE